MHREKEQTSRQRLGGGVFNPGSPAEGGGGRFPAMGSSCHSVPPPLQPATTLSLCPRCFSRASISSTQSTTLLPFLRDELPYPARDRVMSLTFFALHAAAKVVN